MKGILFTPDMFTAATRAIDPKWQTRRIESALAEINQSPEDWTLIGHNYVKFDFRSIDGVAAKVSTRYAKGEIVYVKEPFRVLEFNENDNIVLIEYKRTLQNVNTVQKITISEDTAFKLSQWKRTQRWISPLMMFADFARVKIQITDVRIERLQSITEEDCIAEGLTVKAKRSEFTGRFSFDSHPFEELEGASYKDSYRFIIGSIHGHHLWEQNPYLVVYHFKKINP